MGKPAPLSPLAPAAFPELPGIGGVRFATAQAGVRYSIENPASYVDANLVGFATEDAGQDVPLGAAQGETVH